MNTEMLARFRTSASEKPEGRNEGNDAQETTVTNCAVIVTAAGYAPTPEKARSYGATPVTAKNIERANATHRFLKTAESSEIEVAVEERAGMASDRIPHVYRDIWARLNHQQPCGVSEEQWRHALDDGGLFLDAWGDRAAALQWTPDNFLSLVWRLAGQQVEQLEADHAATNLGRTIKRRMQ